MSDDALGLVSLLEALPSEHTQNDPAQLGDDLTPDLIKQQFQTGSLTMDISSGEESDGQENIESADDFNLNTAQKCNLEKRLDRLEVEKITKELHTTANDVCPNGGFPQLLLQVRKPKLSSESFQMAEQVTQMCLVDKKLRFTLAKQMEIIEYHVQEQKELIVIKKQIHAVEQGIKAIDADILRKAVERLQKQQQEKEKKREALRQSVKANSFAQPDRSLVAKQAAQKDARAKALAAARS